MATLQDLLTPRTRATIEAILMATLQEAPIEGMPGVSFPVTDWLPGSFERTMLKMIATGYVDREDVVTMVTAGGFLDLAAQITDADGNLIEGWMELLAAQNYNNPRGEATYTKQMLLLTCTAGPGPYTRAAGEIVAYAPATGNKYTNVASVTIPDGGSVTAVFQAESPGLGYNDAAGSIIALVTPMPGVSVNNSGEPLIQTGSDKEPLALLAKECRDRWPSLSTITTPGHFEGLAFYCSKTNGLGITKCKASPSLDVPGVENVYIAGSTATATPTQVATVQAFIDARKKGEAAVIAAQAHLLTPGGTVKCKRGTTDEVKKAADLDWAIYIAAIPIGGSEPEGKVLLAELEQALMDAGAYNVVDLTLGATRQVFVGGDMMDEPTDVVLSAFECPTIADTLSHGLTWLEV